MKKFSYSIAVLWDKIVHSVEEFQNLRIRDMETKEQEIYCNGHVRHLLLTARQVMNDLSKWEADHPKNDRKTARLTADVLDRLLERLEGNHPTKDELNNYFRIRKTEMDILDKINRLKFKTDVIHENMKNRQQSYEELLRQEQRQNRIRKAELEEALKDLQKLPMRSDERDRLRSEALKELDRCSDDNFLVRWYMLQLADPNKMNCGLFSRLKKNGTEAQRKRLEAFLNADSSTVAERRQKALESAQERFRREGA